MKKLIPALALLLVSAVMLGTSSFAWFSMNTTVQATGMEVKAATAKNLVISATSAVGSDENNTAASSFTDLVELTPASVQTLAGSQNFFKVNNNNVNYASGAMETGATTVATTPITEGTAGEVVKHTFYIRIDGKAGDAFDKLYVSSITVSATSQNITKALRVGVVSGSNGYIYAPVDGATTSYKGIVAAGTKGTNDIEGASNVTLTAVNTASASLGSVAQNAYTQVDVYIWYEGQDANCTSANSVNVEALSISIGFTAANN